MVDQDAPEGPYVKVRVQGWGGKLPVRRVIFRTRSHDQGKSPDAAVMDIRSKLTVLYTGFSGYSSSTGHAEGRIPGLKPEYNRCRRGSPRCFQCTRIVESIILRHIKMYRDKVRRVYGTSGFKGTSGGTGGEGKAVTAESLDGPSDCLSIPQDIYAGGSRPE